LRDFLGDQTKLWRTFGIALVMEGHWFQPQERFAGVAHRFEVLLEPARAGCRAKLTGGVDNHRGSCDYRATNTLDKGGRLCRSNSNSVGFARFSQTADIDIVTAGSEIVPGLSAQSNIVRAVVLEK